MSRRLPFHSPAIRPPPLLVALFVLSYGMVTGFQWLSHRFILAAGGTVDERDPLALLQWMVLGLTAAGYACFRLARFHPACNTPYAEWLKLTPWTAAKPLPLGPIHPVWQDAALIALLMAITRWHAHGASTIPLVAFGLVYSLGLTALLAVTRRWWHCFLLGLLWPAFLLPALRGWLGGVIIVAVGAVLWHGHRQSLRAFPAGFANADATRNLLQTDISAINAPGPDNRVGWPLQVLSPKLKTKSMATKTAVATSLLLGWWTFCFNAGIPLDPAPEWILVLAIAGALVRLGLYGSAVMAPMHLGGRIVSERLILPGYDQVFLTPLAAAAGGMVAYELARRSGAWYPEAEAGGVALVWCVLFAGGPTLQHWMLTGQHYLRPPARNSRRLWRPV